MPAIVALLLAIAFGSGAVAAPPRDVRVGLYENDPKIHSDATGEAKGFFVDILEAVAQRENWRLRYVKCIWNDCLALLERGELDLMPDVAYSDDRAQRFSFNRVNVVQGWSDLSVPVNSPIHVLADLKGRRIAVLQGSIQQANLDRLMRTEALPYSAVPVDTLDGGFSLVRQGRADAAVANNFFSNKNADRFGLVASSVLFEPVAFYFATARGRNVDLLARIDAHLHGWKTDADSPFFDAMRSGLAPRRPDGLSRNERRAIAALGILALLAGAWVVSLRWQVKRHVRDLTRSYSHLEHLLGAVPVVLYQICQWEEQPQLHWQENALARSFGFSAERPWPLETWLARVHEEDRDRVRRHLLGIPHAGKLIQDYRLRDVDGAFRTVRDEARWSRGDGTRPAEVVGCVSDLTEAREQAEQLRFLAHHDDLTSLANRVQLDLCLAVAVDAARASGERLALLVLNIDRLQRVNDAIGHDAGDAVLVEVARRIKATSGPNTLVARLGGDEFAVVIPDCGDTEDIIAIAGCLFSEVERPLAFGSHLITVSASIGVSVFPGDGNTPSALLMGADTALAHAKLKGRGGFSIVTEQMNLSAQRWTAIEHNLRYALERHELSLVYQPIATVGDGSICGVEALLRWHNPTLGPVSPAEFIPVAEDAGLMETIGEWVLRSACQQVQDWQAQGLPPIRTAVNVSALQIRSGTLPGVLRDIHASTGFDLQWLEIELTESVMMQDSETALAQITELVDMGVSVSLDDFGTGYSSLSYLSRFPFGTLKIDQSFVQNMIEDSRSAALANGAIGIAHDLDLKVIAEGVETRAQLDYLTAAGCDEVQGYLLSRPLAPDALARLFREHASLPAN